MVKKIHKNLEKTTQKLSIVNGTKAYIELRETVIKHGILKRAYGFYLLLSLFTFFGLFFSAYEIFITPISLQLIGWCFAISFFTVQFGGLMHDASHKAIAKSTKINTIIGSIFSGMIAIEYNAWHFSHSKHHSHTNEVDEDPDLELPLHGFTKRQFLKQKGLWKLLRRFQVYLYYPFRMLSVDAKRMDALSYFRETKKIGMWWEVIAWIIGMSVYFLLPFLLFPFPKALLVFLFIHLVTGFYFSNIFAPNHKGMPELPKGTKISFLEHQIMTSRNVYGHWLTDFVFMGLNYQIEHHLFPNCPRNKLKEITPFVQEVCRKMHLEYTAVSVIESNKIILATLHQIASSSE